MTAPSSDSATGRAAIESRRPHDVRTRIALALALVSAATSGCWTGRLIEVGRISEQVARYDRVVLVDDALHLDYRVTLTNARRETIGHGERSARIELAALAADPEWPVDTFPVEHDPTPAHGGQDLVITNETEDPHFEVTPVATVGAPRVALQIDSDDGRHAGFRICEAAAPDCAAHFHSGALHVHHMQWWVYPLAPFAAAIDLALVPAQLATWPWLILAGD